MKLYWSFEGAECAAAGAIPPEPMSLAYGRRAKDSPFRSQNYRQRWRAIEAGYRVVPSDCPPVRLIAGYGLLVRCPGEVRIQRSAEPRPERIYDGDRAAYGLAELGGTPWPVGDSGFVASWISGSEFAKIQTGIRIHFPAHMHLYQGPLPNETLLEGHRPEVMAGLEYASAANLEHIGGIAYGVATLNVIVRLSQKPMVLHREEALAWVFPVPKGNPSLERRGE